MILTILAIFHTILFNRLLGKVSGGEEKSDVFNLYYPVIESISEPVHYKGESIKNKVLRDVQAIYESLVKQKSGYVQLSFYTSQVVSNWLPLADKIWGSKEERSYWERWVLSIKIKQKSNGPGNAERFEMLSEELRNKLFEVVRKIDEKDDHVQWQNTKFSVCIFKMFIHSLRLM
jgi:hypothetical protein